MQAMDRMRRLQVGRLYPDLTPTEEHLLTVVMEHPDGITVSALAKKLEMPMSAVSRVMRNLEKRSLIERRIMPQDRRSIIVSITPEGRASCEALHACLHSFFLEMLDSFDTAEFDHLIETWNIVMDRMEEVLERHLAQRTMQQKITIPIDTHKEDTE